MEYVLFKKEDIDKISEISKFISKELGKTIDNNPDLLFDLGQLYEGFDRIGFALEEGIVISDYKYFE